MNARTLTAATATFALVFSGVLPARAADPQLLTLVMPDAQVLAGVNVEQAKTTPFGVYVLSQVPTNNADFQKLITLTGFDPTRDVREVLCASVGSSAQHSGLLLARGNFDPSKIASAAAAHGASTTTYNGVTIIQDPKGTNGIAFLSTSIVAAGDIASVKGAIDRQSRPASLPAALAVQVNQWSTSQDAWAISAAPLNTLHPSPAAPPVPGLNGAGVFQSVQSAAGGVKFGNVIVVTAQAQADTAQNAQAMGDSLKLLANLAQLQGAQNPALVTLAQSLKVTTNGTVMNASISLAEDQLQQVLKSSQANQRPNHRPGPSGVRR